MRLKEVIAFVLRFKNNLVYCFFKIRSQTLASALKGGGVMEYVIWDVKQDVNLKEGDVIE